MRTSDKIIPTSTNTIKEPEITTATLKLDDEKTTTLKLDDEKTTAIISSSTVNIVASSTVNIAESILTSKIIKPIDSTLIQSTTTSIIKKLEEPLSVSSTFESSTLESATTEINKKPEESSNYKPHTTQSIRISLNNSVHTYLPSSIEKIFGNANLSVLLVTGGLIIVAAPTVIFFAIYFVYKKRKYQLKSAYTEFDDMLKTESNTIIKRIRRIQSDGTLKNIAKKSLSISSNASKNSKNSQSDNKNKCFKNKKSKINVVFKDEFNENTNL